MSGSALALQRRIQVLCADLLETEQALIRATEHDDRRTTMPIPASSVGAGAPPTASPSPSEGAAPNAPHSADPWAEANDLAAAARAEIARLRTLAEAATPGPWEPMQVSGVRAGMTVVAPHWTTARDAAHIAAWDPARVLRVLDAAEKTLDRHAPCGDECDDCGMTYPCRAAAAVLDTYLPETP